MEGEREGRGLAHYLVGGKHGLSEEVTCKGDSSKGRSRAFD